MIMATPILADLRKRFPDASITAMCCKPLSDLLIQNPNIDEIFAFSRPSNRFARREESRDIVKKVRAGNFDLGILLTNSFSSAWYFWQGKVKRRIGFAKHFRSFLLSDPLPLFVRGSEHEVYTYKRLLAPLGIENTTTVPQLYLEEDEVKAAKRLLYQRGYQEGKFLIGINVGAAYGSAKCWPADRFRAVAEELLEQDGVYLLFFGDASTASLVKEICHGLPKQAINLAGMTTIRELACLIKSCDVLLTNDSGPMHMGAAIQVRLVALFGSTNEEATGPFGQPEAVIHKHPSCSPCFKRTCPIDFRCMKEISINEVLAKVNSQLKRTYHE
jgi:heptosyltransferase-2